MEHNELIQKIEKLEREMSEMKESRGFKGFLRRAFRRSSVLAGVMIAALLSGIILYAAQVSFTEGEVISATDVNANFTELYIATGRMVPIGTIVAWHKSMTGTPSLPEGWLECNGQTVADVESSYDGQVLPNLNGEGRFLRGGSTSGTLQDSQNLAHTHNYGDYYWHDSGAVDEFENPTGDGMGERLQVSRTTNTSGGSEARPINMSIIWIIKVK